MVTRLGIAAVLMLGACTGPAAAPGDVPTPTSSGPAATSPAAGTPNVSPTAPPSPTTTAGAVADPWRSVALTDVRSGETVSPAALAGKLLVIEPMAIWCANCRAQQNELRTALETIGRPDDVVAVSLDVDPFEQAADLARYADERGYPWHFAIAGPDVSRLLAEAFGDGILSPPSTPKIIVAPDGTAEVVFGFRSADELVDHFESLLP